MEAIAFDPARDRLWFVGDLVNRGPQSLECLRYVKGLGPAAVTVLGNHDLHLVCRAHGVVQAKKRDTLDDVLHAPDRDELVAWLRTRPLFHLEGRHAMVHAGLLPSWTIATAQALAAEVQARLAGDDFMPLLQQMYGDQPDRWSDDLTGIDRLRVIINAMTRLRVCAQDGSMVLGYKGEPGEVAGKWTPWFDLPGRRSGTHVVVMGHWSALGFLQREDLLALDSGCVWGRALTAVRLEDARRFQVECPEAG